MEVQVTASVTSSTHERKSKTWILTKKGRFYLRHGAFQYAGPAAFLANHHCASARLQACVTGRAKQTTLLLDCPSLPCCYAYPSLLSMHVPAVVRM